jgi:para-aminobenzoate synthetase/4-amino-4-deoxychorismate lyase
MTIYCEIDFPLLPTLSDEERERYQFTDPVAVHAAYAVSEVVDVLEAVVRASDRGHWCVGFVAHEAASAFDAALVTKPLRGRAGEQPDAEPHAQPVAWFAEFAMRTHGRAEAKGEFVLSEWQSDVNAAEFADCVESIRRDIRDGRFYQVNYTTRLAAHFNGDALSFYRALQAAQPRGYHAFIDAGTFQLLSVSPELFFSMRDGVVTTQPMKGTAPRGDTPDQDAALADALTHSPKERAENLMIVDLLRNDLSRISTPHSVEVPHLFSLHALPSVWSMTSTVRAHLRSGLSLTDVFRALFPCGSVTGAPKVEAMKAIRHLEGAPRGAYCGAIGVVEPGGAACFNVGIRSVWIDGEADRREANFGVGSGITFDSTVEGEAAELVYKTRFVQRASKPFDLFETLLLEAGKFGLIERHLARMASSARHFRLPYDESATRAALRAIATAHPAGQWRVRLISRADGRVATEVFALTPLPAVRQVCLAATAVSSADEFLQHKTTRRETYDRHAPTNGEWDTLLWNERGELTEFIRANLVLDLNGRRLTPPANSGLLNGTLRDELLAAGQIHEQILKRADLANADKIWWVNSLRGQLQVELPMSKT